MNSKDKVNGHILLVEDEGYLLYALADFLDDQGYVVDAVEDPLKALELFEQKVFDLVVTDYRLPNLTGLELLQRVKEKNPQIEVILITGYGSKESVLEALRLNAYAFIEKPFDAMELLNTVANCLGTIRLRARIDRLVVDLQENQRQLEQALADRDHQLVDQQDYLTDVAAVVDVLEQAMSTIDGSANSIWDDARVCRVRRSSFLSDVSRLVSTCSRETRRITGSVSELETIARELDTAARQRPAVTSPPVTKVESSPGAASARTEPVPETPTFELDVADQDIGPIYSDMRSVVTAVVTAVQSGEQIDIAPIRQIVSTLLEKEGALDALYARAISSGGSGEWDIDTALVTHSVNVAIYAMKLGEGLDFGVPRMTNLGTAALLHDVGMLSLPEEIFSKETLDKKEQEALRNHPVRGAEYLSHLDTQDAWLAEIALQEHEREDGSGYPNGLTRNQIREEAKIIGLVDTYAGLVASRPDRRGLTPFDAVKEITQTHRKRFHLRILRALLQKLSAFPVGSLVRLNSGIVGRVSQTFEAYPLRPVVVPLYDGDNWSLEDAKPISLRENPILHISGVVYPEDKHTRSS